MALDSEDIATLLATLDTKMDGLSRRMSNVEGIVQDVATHAVEITALKKDNSGHHQAINELALAEASRKGSAKTLYWVMGLFAGSNLLSNIIVQLIGVKK